MMKFCHHEESSTISFYHIMFIRYAFGPWKTNGWLLHKGLRCRPWRFRNRRSSTCRCSSGRNSGSWDRDAGCACREWTSELTTPKTNGIRTLITKLKRSEHGVDHTEVSRKSRDPLKIELKSKEQIFHAIIARWRDLLRRSSIHPIAVEALLQSSRSRILCSKTLLSNVKHAHIYHCRLVQRQIYFGVLARLSYTGQQTL